MGKGAFHRVLVTEVQQKSREPAQQSQNPAQRIKPPMKTGSPTRMHQATFQHVANVALNNRVTASDSDLVDAKAHLAGYDSRTDSAEKPKAQTSQKGRGG